MVWLIRCRVGHALIAVLGFLLVGCDRGASEPDRPDVTVLTVSRAGAFFDDVVSVHDGEGELVGSFRVGEGREPKEFAFLGDRVLVRFDSSIEAYALDGDDRVEVLVSTADSSLSQLAAGEVHLAVVQTERRACEGCPLTATLVAVTGDPGVAPVEVTIPAALLEGVEAVNPVAWSGRSAVVVALAGGGGEQPPDLAIVSLDGDVTMVEVPGWALVSLTGDRVAIQSDLRSICGPALFAEITVLDLPSGREVAGWTAAEDEGLHIWEWSPDGRELLYRSAEDPTGSGQPFSDCGQGAWLDWYTYGTELDRGQRVDVLAEYARWYDARRVTFRCAGEETIGRRLASGATVAPECSDDSGRSLAVEVLVGGHVAASGVEPTVIGVIEAN
jgi:hypothetical protein